MKKFLLLVVVLLGLAGCIRYKYAAMPQKELRSEYCLNTVDYVEVQQVIDKGVLITLCQSCTATHCNCKAGERWYFWPRDVKNVVDDQLLRVDEGKCLANDGVYSYTAALGGLGLFVK